MELLIKGKKELAIMDYMCEIRIEELEEKLQEPNVVYGENVKKRINDELLVLRQWRLMIPVNGEGMPKLRDKAKTLLMLLSNATGAEFEDEGMAVDIIEETLLKTLEESSL